MGIKELRSEIDLIDAELIRLIWKRIEVARDIGNIKADSRTAVEDPERESEVLGKWDGLEPVAREVIRLSKKEQVNFSHRESIQITEPQTGGEVNMTRETRRYQMAL
ncbi:MAG: chorismate mutase [archaeon]